MSYAYEVFGIKETRHDIWMQDLILAGTSSATFGSDRMMELAASPFAKENGWLGYYLILWAKRNGVSLKDILRVGQKVAIQNHDYGTVDTYVLHNISDTVCSFISTGYMNYLPMLPSNVDYFDGVIASTVPGAWFAAETPNWYNPSLISSSGILNPIAQEYGYFHGIDEEFKDILNANTSSYYKAFTPFASVNPLATLKTFKQYGVTFCASPTAIYMHKLTTSAATNISYSIQYWSIMMPTSTTQNNTIPLAAAVYLPIDKAVSLENANAATYDSSNYTITNVDATAFDGTTVNVTSTVPTMRTRAGVLGCFYVEN